MKNDIDYNKIKQSKKEYRLIKIEKGYSGHLSAIGKIACFEFNFHNITITDDHIEMFLPIKQPTKTISFIEGYTRAEEMFHLGFNIEQYKTFLEKINPRIKSTIDKILDNAIKSNQNSLKK